MSPRQRRAQGDGSVHKRGDGRWAGYVTLANNERKYVYGRTQADVKNQLKVLRTRVEGGKPVDEDKRTVGQYLDWWIKDQKAHLAPETWRGYESKLRLHIKPSLENIRLAKLTPGDVRDLVSKKVAAGYSSKQVNHIHDVLHAALEDAWRMESVDRNVASLVETPRVVSKERKALTVEQANRLLEVTAGDRLHALLRLLLTMGLRPGEGLGLQWKAVDFTESTLRVETTLQRQEGQWILKEPKTAKSKQTLPLPEICADVLRLHRQFQNDERSSAGDHWKEWGLVFARPEGHPCWYSDVGRSLARFCEDAKIPVVTLHELRHSTPSILLSLGVDQRVIMQVLRHSTIVLTANLYTHVADPLVRDALKRIDDALRD